MGNKRQIVFRRIKLTSEQTQAQKDKRQKSQKKRHEFKLLRFFYKPPANRRQASLKGHQIDRQCMFANS